MMHELNDERNEIDINTDELSRNVSIAIEEWDKPKLVELVQHAMASGLSALAIVQDVLCPKLLAACRSYDAFDLSFSELLLMADTIKAALDLLIPEIKAATEETGQKGTVVIGTVEGDIHDFGKELVAAVFQSGGYRVVDLGRDVPLEKFIKTAEEENADIIAISALMTPALINMEKLIKRIKERNMKVKTIIGGLAPSKDFARRIGADSWAEDALAGLHELDALLKNS